MPREARSSTRALRHWSSFTPWSRTRPKLSEWLSQRPKLRLTTRTPASTSRRAISRWSLQVGAPSYWNLYGLPSPYASRIFGSSFDRSSASRSRLPVSTSKARCPKESIPSMMPLESMSRRRRSTLASRRRRSASRSSGIDLSVMFSMSGPSGLNGEKAGPRKPGMPESDHGTCCVRAARPTKGGTAGSTGPRSLAMLEPIEGRPPIDLRLFSGQPVMHWKPAWAGSHPTTERMTANLSMRVASFGKTSQICRPETFVSIGRNSPRTSLGASGLRSHMS